MGKCPIPKQCGYFCFANLWRRWSQAEYVPAPVTLARLSSSAFIHRRARLLAKKTEKPHQREHEDRGVVGRIGPTSR